MPYPCSSRTTALAAGAAATGALRCRWWLVPATGVCRTPVAAGPRLRPALVQVDRTSVPLEHPHRRCCLRPALLVPLQIGRYGSTVCGRCFRGSCRCLLQEDLNCFGSSFKGTPVATGPRCCLRPGLLITLPSIFPASQCGLCCSYPRKLLLDSTAGGHQVPGAHRQGPTEQGCMQRRMRLVCSSSSPAVFNATAMLVRSAPSVSRWRAARRWAPHPDHCPTAALLPGLHSRPVPACSRTQMAARTFGLCH